MSEHVQNLLWDSATLATAVAVSAGMAVMFIYVIPALGGMR